MAGPDDTAGSARGSWSAWLARRRARIALALVVLAIAVRVALPPVLRSVIVSQGNKAIAGRLEVGDVDLWLLLGGAALKDVALRAENAAPTDPPLVAFRRFYVQVGWLPLLRRTLRVKDFALDGLAVNVDRLQSGALVLPAVRPGPPQPEAKPAAPGKPWNVVIDQAALRDGHLRLRDYVVEPPEPIELVLDDLQLKHFSLQLGNDSEPGHGVIEAKFGDGTVRLETTVATRQDGFAVDAKVDIANLPLDRTQLHLPDLGWSGLRGRIDAALTVHVEPSTNPVLGGTLALRDLGVEVPGGDEPALAWRRLDVDVEQLDPAARSAVVRRVALDGAAVIVRPRDTPPLPLLAGRRGARTDAPAPPEPPPEGKAAKPWTWSVAALEVSDTVVKVFLEPPPLEMRIVKATATDVSSAQGSSAAVALELREGEGTIALDGKLGLDPLAAHLTVRLDQLALGRLVAATGAVPVLFPGGALGGELTIAAEHPALVVSGKLGLADLKVVPREGEDFSLTWKQLDLGIHEIRVPGVLPGEPVPPDEPVRVDLELLHLSNPSVTLTRTAQGIVLPTAGAPPADAPPPPAAEPPPAGGGGRPLTFALAKLDLEGGQVSVLDRTTKPFYRGRVSAIRATGHGLRYPESVFDDFAISLQAPGNAPLSCKGTRSGGRVQIEAKGEHIPLAQFNPYVTTSGYSIARGAATFGAKAHWQAGGYASQTSLRFKDLDLAGAEGDALFAQRFGMPLTVALGLMRDVHGVIALDVPVSGDRAGGARVDLGAVIAQALAHAMVNALASPLKLIGAVVGNGDKVDATPEPIACAPGKPEVDAEARARVEQLGSVLGSAPALRLELKGTAGGPDVRALQEAALLAELSADKGALAALRNLPSRGTRNAIRDALAARASGKSAELSPELQKTLDEWATQRAVSDGDLRALAAARATHLRSALVQDFGVAADRLALGEPAVDRDAGRPAVAVSLAAGR